MQGMEAPFNPANVPIVFTFNVAQCTLISRALAKLTIEEAGDFLNGFRAHVLQTIQQAEQAHYANKDEPAAIPPVVSDNPDHPHKDTEV